jgi:hypothetical protein
MSAVGLKAVISALADLPQGALYCGHCHELLFSLGQTVSSTTRDQHDGRLCYSRHGIHSSSRESLPLMFNPAKPV